MTLAGFKSSNHPQQTDKRGALDEVDDRGTHPDYFEPWNERFGGFTLDVAAAPHNAKCERYFTREDDGLAQSWAGERVWCNPPYSDLGAWVRKAWDESPDTRGIVMLLPANRVEQKWWQELIEPYRDRDSVLSIEFLPGRMRFIRPNAVIGPKGDRPPFGCCLAIWQDPMSLRNEGIRFPFVATSEQPLAETHRSPLPQVRGARPVVRSDCNHQWDTAPFPGRIWCVKCGYCPPLSRPYDVDRDAS